MGNKDKTKEIIQKYSQEEAKKMVLDMAKPDGDLGQNLTQLGEEILPKFLNGDVEEKSAARNKLESKMLEVMMALETETHVALMESFETRYRGLSKELSIQVISEYQCLTVAEKMLAELAVNAYIRVIDNSRRLNNELCCKNITHERNKYISMLSKQVDRANRQFLSALLTLKQLKSPSIEMNIKTRNAFISQNQQFNTENKSNETI